jgi:glycosyltransferase involved in cell wall biosynthesis
MDKISVIIPVYNVEPYIRKCLDSVISQTYKNLEILLVNDGSTDNSGKICDEYAEKDKRIKVFHKENGGLSSALNVGLENFTGDYLGFVDSDDWIEPDMYETLYKAIKSKNVQISIASYFKDTDTESIPASNEKKISDGIISQKDMLLFPLQRDYYMGFCGYVWNKLYSADIIKANRLSFDNDIKYGMDVLFYYTLMTSCNCIGIYIDKPLYHYLQRDTAISKSKSLSVKADILTVYKRVEELLNENEYSNISYWARGFYCHHASVIAEIAQCEVKSHLKDYVKTNKDFPGKFARMRAILNGW